MTKLIIVSFILCIGNLTAGSFIEEHNINCGDKVEIDKLGYPTWNPAVIFKLPKHGYASLTSKDLAPQKLVYSAPNCVNITDTVVVLCARATQITCDTGYYIFKVHCNSVDTAEFIVVSQLKCNDTLTIENLNAFQIPVIKDSAKYGSSELIYFPTDGVAVKYIPNKDYEGPDFIKINLRNNRIIFYLINVYCNSLSSVDEIPKNKLDVKAYIQKSNVVIQAPEKIHKLHLWTLEGNTIYFEEESINENTLHVRFRDDYKGLIIGNVKTQSGSAFIKLIKH
ncbi:MAG: hypothetical protein HOP11_00095 [Saprospiraceae bacterium]|nr:hypothetical protein [Saprospiraceae bacterium]